MEGVYTFFITIFLSFKVYKKIEMLLFIHTTCIKNKAIKFKTTN